MTRWLRLVRIVAGVLAVVLGTVVVSVLSPGAPLASAITYDETLSRLITLQSTADAINTRTSNIDPVLRATYNNVLNAVSAAQGAQNAANAANSTIGAVNNVVNSTNTTLNNLDPILRAGYNHAVATDTRLSNLDPVIRNTFNSAGGALTQAQANGVQIQSVLDRIAALKSAADTNGIGVADLQAGVAGLAAQTAGVAAQVNEVETSLLSGFSNMLAQIQTSGGGGGDQTNLLLMLDALGAIKALLQGQSGASCVDPRTLGIAWSTPGIQSGCVVNRQQSAEQAEGIERKIGDVGSGLQSGIDQVNATEEAVWGAVEAAERAIRQVAAQVVSGIAAQVQAVKDAAAQAHADAEKASAAGGGGLSGPGAPQGAVSWVSFASCLGTSIASAGTVQCGGVEVPIGFGRHMTLLDGCGVPWLPPLRDLIGALFVIGCAWFGGKAIMAGFSYNTGGSGA